MRATGVNIEQSDAFDEAVLEFLGPVGIDAR